MPAAALTAAHARLARARGEAQLAFENFVEAAERYDAAGVPYLQARAELEAASTGLACGDAGLRDQCRDLLRHAHAVFEELGSPLAAGSLDLLRRNRWDMRTAGAPATLSPREREIAELIAEGQSTRAIASRLVLSPRTVDNHVARMFEKLGVHSRAALASNWRDLANRSPR